LAGVAACLMAAPVQRAHAQTPAAPTTPGFTVLQGVVADSVHGMPLPNATVRIEGTNRSATTSEDGHFRIDSIPPGQHRIDVTHPLLDTLGIQMRTQEYPFEAGGSHEISLIVPGGAQLVANLCSSPDKLRGPAAMVGFVRDPDSGGPAIAAEVELVYYVTDPVGRKFPRVRRVPVDSAGMYRICGLPADMTGKVQVFRGGVSSGEVPVEMLSSLVLPRAFSVAQHQTVALVKGDSGKIVRIAKGTARVTGKVVDKKGQPLSGARITLQGGGETVISRPNGEFALDSLPSGTQALEVRKLGYASTDAAVELSSNKPARTTVVMGDFVPTLAAMRVEAAVDKGLSKVGYLQRKQMGMGSFMDGKAINHEAISFADVMRAAPGITVQPLGDGRTYVIRDSRTAGGGCVNFWVDGTPYPEMTPGDISDYVQPSELVAVEIYHGTETPAQYQTSGQTGCATVVAWTVARVRPDKK
jgi:hypothetical protein